MTNHEIKELISILKKEGCNSKKQAIEYLEGKLNKKEKERNGNLRLKKIMKKQKIREKIKRLVEIIANKKRWEFYRILNLDVILNNKGKFAEANITVNFCDKNGIPEQLVSSITKITQKDFLSNAKIY